jgi:UDP-N-acetylglucosamine 3-dehydrogenase
MTLKTAVIGVGSMGRNHARVYWQMPDVVLAGVSDIDESTADRIAAQYDARAFTDYETMLDTVKPDAVSIAVPTEDHLKTAMAVIQRGIHLLIEKPIAFSRHEAQEIIAAAKEAGIKLMVGHIERFNPAVQLLKQHLLEKRLGRIFQISARRQGPFPARIRDVGVVVDLAVHDLDVMRFVTGEDIIRVYAETEHQIRTDHEDLFAGLVRLADGAIGTLSINWLTPTKIRELSVIGELGMYYVNYLTQDLFFYENTDASGPEWETMRVLRGVAEGQMIRHVVKKKEPLLAELESFTAAITGGAPVAVSGKDGLEALNLAKAMVESGRTSQPINL